MGSDKLWGKKFLMKEIFKNEKITHASHSPLLPSNYTSCILE